MYIAHAAAVFRLALSGCVYFQNETSICLANLISVLFNARRRASRLRDAALHDQHGPD